LEEERKDSNSKGTAERALRVGQEWVASEKAGPGCGARWKEGVKTAEKQKGLLYPNSSKGSWAS